METCKDEYKDMEQELEALRQHNTSQSERIQRMAKIIAKMTALLEQPCVCGRRPGDEF